MSLCDCLSPSPPPILSLTHTHTHTLSSSELHEQNPGSFHRQLEVAYYCTSSTESCVLITYVFSQSVSSVAHDIQLTVGPQCSMIKSILHSLSNGCSSFLPWGRGRRLFCVLILFPQRESGAHTMCVCVCVCVFGAHTRKKLIVLVLIRF